MLSYTKSGDFLQMRHWSKIQQLFGPLMLKQGGSDEEKILLDEELIELRRTVKLFLNFLEDHFYES
jgi:hypothetical protein